MIPRGAQPWRLAALGEALQLPFRGDPNRILRAASDLGSAGEDELAALYDSRYFAQAESSKAGALIVPAELAGAWPDRNVLWSAAPKAAFACAIELLHPLLWPAPGIDATARIAASATIDPAATIGPYATIGERCAIGPRSVIGAGAVLLDDVSLGEAVQVHPRVVLYGGTLVEDRAIIFAGAVIGAPGFGHAIDAEQMVVSLAHLGRVVVCAGAEVGANSTVDRATFGETRIERAARIDNLVQIGHNARVGRQAMIAAQCGLSGGSSLGDGAMMGGQSGIGPQIDVGAGAAVAAKSAVLQDVAAGEAVAGHPALPMARWRRIVAIESRLPEWWREWRASRAVGAVLNAERRPEERGGRAGEE